MSRKRYKLVKGDVKNIQKSEAQKEKILSRMRLNYDILVLISEYDIFNYFKMRTINKVCRRKKYQCPCGYKNF